MLINSVGAHWEGNQVWLILAGGALFAAWPRVYAAAFSGFYVAMILVLCALFFRPLAFDYRGKIANARWRAMWDTGLVIGSLVPPVIFGVAFGNLFWGCLCVHTTITCAIPGHFLGIALSFCPTVRRIKPDVGHYAGGVWLQLKTDGILHLRALSATRRSAMLVVLCFLLAGYWLWTGIDGYVLLSQILMVRPIRY